jgi:hypothetical protein
VPGSPVGGLIAERSACHAMTALRMSSELSPGAVYRLDLDDFDALIAALRSGARTFRVMANEILISEPYDLAALGQPIVHTLDIEAHEPYVRLRFGAQAVPEGRSRKYLELATIPGEGDALFERIERIVVSTRRAQPIRDCWRESDSFLSESLAWVLGGGFLVLLACLGVMAWLLPAPMTDDAASSLNPYVRAGLWAALLPAVILVLSFLSTVSQARLTSVEMTRGRRKKVAPKDALDL